MCVDDCAAICSHCRLSSALGPPTVLGATVRNPHAAGTVLLTVHVHAHALLYTLVDRLAISTRDKMYHVPNDCVTSQATTPTSSSGEGGACVVDPELDSGDSSEDVD